MKAHPSLPPPIHTHVCVSNTMETFSPRVRGSSEGEKKPNYSPLPLFCHCWKLTSTQSPRHLLFSLARLFLDRNSWQTNDWQATSCACIKSFTKAAKNTSRAAACALQTRQGLAFRKKVGEHVLKHNCDCNKVKRSFQRVSELEGYAASGRTKLKSLLFNKLFYKLWLLHVFL